MPENKLITVLGGDMRLITAAKYFSKNFSVFSYGWGDFSNQPGITACSCQAEALSRGGIILLGIPCSVDGKTLNAPLCDKKTDIELLADTLPCNTVICGGALPDVLKNRFINAIDYNDDEYFQYQNARLTAEGALMYAIAETPFSIAESTCLVLGSGRITKAIVPMLKALNAKTTVIARKRTDRELWKMHGVDAAEFSHLTEIMDTADIVFNTVPAPVIGKPQLDAMQKNCVIIDLASRPGGTDFEYAKKKGIKALHALALPGKTAPHTAGKIIYETVMSLLKEREVIF